MWQIAQCVLLSISHSYIFLVFFLFLSCFFHLFVVYILCFIYKIATLIKYSVDDRRDDMFNAIRRYKTKWKKKMEAEKQEYKKQWEDKMTKNRKIATNTNRFHSFCDAKKEILNLKLKIEGQQQTKKEMFKVDIRFCCIFLSFFFF